MMVYMIFLFYILLRIDRIVFVIFWMYEGVLLENGMIIIFLLFNINFLKFCINKRVCVICICK